MYDYCVCCNQIMYKQNLLPISLHLEGEQQNKTNPNSNTLCSAQDSNWMRTKYYSEAIPVFASS